MPRYCPIFNRSRPFADEYRANDLACIGHDAKCRELLLTGDGLDHQIPDCRVDRLCAYCAPCVPANSTAPVVSDAVCRKTRRLSASPFFRPTVCPSDAQKNCMSQNFAKPLICSKGLILRTTDFARSQEVENREQKTDGNEESWSEWVSAKSARKKRKTPRGTWPCGVFQEDKERVFVEGSGGPADEAYYRCKVCGHEWLHETGSCGMGWVV